MTQNALKNEIQELINKIRNNTASPEDYNKLPQLQEQYHIEVLSKVLI